MKDFSSRPVVLKDFVGKKYLKESLQTYIESAKIRKTTLDHIIFYGSPGVGKTSLATVIANELGAKIHYIQGPSVRKISDVLDLVSMIQHGDVVFIDEIHQVNIKCLEMFYSILEDFVADVKIGKEFNAQFSRLNVPRFTLICSTTNFGKLPTPFIDRFGIKFFIDLYEPEELMMIIDRICEHNEIKLLDIEKNIIASSSKGTPRITINLLNRFLDYRLINNEMNYKDIFKAINIFPLGLNDVDLAYLKVLYNSDSSVGIRSICQQLFLDLNTVENTIEPYLLRMNLITKNSFGRALSIEGKNYLRKLEFANT